jgi:hypothetical protein
MRDFNELNVALVELGFKEIKTSGPCADIGYPHSHVLDPAYVNEYLLKYEDALCDVDVEIYNDLVDLAVSLERDTCTNNLLVELSDLDAEGYVLDNEQDWS